jgi:signal transduction histidine kinase
VTLIDVEYLAGSSAPDAWSKLQDRIISLGGALRRGELSRAEVDTVAELFAELCQHPKWEVRHAVAEAMQYLRHDSFEQTIGALVKDRHAYVKAAAKRALKRRHEDAYVDPFRSAEQTRRAEVRNPAARREGERFAEVRLGAFAHEANRIIQFMLTVLARVEMGDGTIAPQDIAKLGAGLECLFALVRDTGHLMKVYSTPFERENLREMVEEAVGLVREGMSKPSPEAMMVDIDVDADLAVEARRPALVMAFRNVIKNGVDAYVEKAEPARIQVRARRLRHRVEVSFTDYGCGIAPENMKHVFDAYSTTKPMGTGLGLAIVRKYVEMDHGGSVKIESTEGKGTTVRVVLPLEQVR